MKNKSALFLLIFFAVVYFESCKKDIVEPVLITSVSDDFESGSIGEVTKISNTDWDFYLADDNNNPDLPDKWRNWWFVRMENINTDSVTKISLKNRGWPFYYLPVYSYDNSMWLRFSEDEVSQNQDDELIIQKQFEKKTVWLARFYPYTYTDLEKYLDGISGSPFLEIQTPGYSQMNKAMYLLKISNFAVSDSLKNRVFIHARSHPGEVPASFVVEGLVDYLLSASPRAKEILNTTEIYIFPMHNIDGVIAGNYRSTPETENLEVMWYYDAENPIELTADAPQEVNIIHDYAKLLMTGKGPRVSMALNIHASNSEADVRPFFFPHFGPETLGYDTLEYGLWNKQLRFISSLAANYGSDMLEPVPTEGGSSFASKTYPESWWWVNFKDEVMAITMEMTYGRAGYSPKWVSPDNLRELGASLALGIGDYYNNSSDKLMMLPSKRLKALKYPGLYPPLDENTSKN
jgi:hypothetical protein